MFFCHLFDVMMMMFLVPFHLLYVLSTGMMLVVVMLVVSFGEIDTGRFLFASVMVVMMTVMTLLEIRFRSVDRIFIPSVVMMMTVVTFLNVGV